MPLSPPVLPSLPLSVHAFLLLGVGTSICYTDPLSSPPLVRPSVTGLSVHVSVGPSSCLFTLSDITPSLCPSVPLSLFVHFFVLPFVCWPVRPFVVNIFLFNSAEKVGQTASRPNPSLFYKDGFSGDVGQ